MLSRHAEAVYWLARYMERAEDTARMVDVTYRTMLEASALPDGHALTWEPPLDITFERFRFLGRDGRRLDNDEQAMEFLCFDPENPSSVLTCIERARQNALSARDQISSEMTEELNKFHRWVLEAKSSGILHEHPHDFFQEVKTRCHLFEGVTQNTLLRDEGWNFHLAGRWLERGLQTARLLEVQYAQLESVPTRGSAVGGTDQHLWISVLKSVGAYEAYRRRFLTQIQPRRVVELLVLDREFPRSLSLAGGGLVQATSAIAMTTGGSQTSEPNRLARRLAGLLSTSLVDEVLITGPVKFLADCQDQLRRIHDALSVTYFVF